jgi:hypothetical protein
VHLKEPSGPSEVGVVTLASVDLVKSRQRVANHGEVFTPAWMVEAMLDLVKEETERIDSRFLEPACGSGNFLVQVLRRKLTAVELRFGRSQFEKQNYALLGLMCIYGIELLDDNIAECRDNLLAIFAEYLRLEGTDDLYCAATHVLAQNLIQGDALTMRTTLEEPIVFAEWAYLGKGRFQRRDFRLDVLTQSAAFSQEGTLFAELGKHEIFTPMRTYAPASTHTPASPTTASTTPSSRDSTPTRKGARARSRCSLGHLRSICARVIVARAGTRRPSGRSRDC